MNSCYDSTMSDSDKLINFIATTVEGLRQRIDSISEQMATKVDLANLRDEMAAELTAMKDQMVTKDELAAVKAQMATNDELKDGLAALRIEMATKRDLGRLETTMRGELSRCTFGWIRLIGESTRASVRLKPMSVVCAAWVICWLRTSPICCGCLAVLMPL